MPGTSFLSRVLLTAGLTAFLSAASFAQQTPTAPTTPTAPPVEGAKPVKRISPLKKMLDELPLTPEQQAKVKDILKDAGKKRKTMRDNTALTADQKKEQGKEIEKATLDAVNAVLTPEQQKKLKEEMAAAAAAKKHHKKGDAAAAPGASGGTTAPKGI